MLLGAGACDAGLRVCEYVRRWLIFSSPGFRAFSPIFIFPSCSFLPRTHIHIHTNTHIHTQRVKGIVGTAVGYTQGAKETPTYSEVCSGSTGHTEAVECIYDPKEVKLEEILDVFWGRHNPTQLNRQGNDVG